jgi:hypothetical protein
MLNSGKCRRFFWEVARAGLYCNTVSKKLNRSPIIRRFFAGLLLLLFAFSNTPKKTLHDFFANHKDVPVRSSGSKTLQFSQSGFNCHCEDLVVELPFIGAMPLPELATPACWRPVAYPAIRSASRPAPPRYFELRGPPERPAGKPLS